MTARILGLIFVSFATSALICVAFSREKDEPNVIGMAFAALGIILALGSVGIYLILA